MNNDRDSQPHYTAVSLFCGSGGLDLGFTQTGRIEVLFANDIDRFACQSYQLNLGDHVLCADIRTVTSVPEADVLMGGPPCQGFSTANPHRSFDDPRNWLFKEYARILSMVNPKIFVMENVAGMASLEGGTVLTMILNELKGLGFNVQYRILNAMDFGVAQSRRRTIIVGTRSDIERVYRYPDPVILPPMFGQYKTVGDVLSGSFDDLPNHEVAKLSALNLERIAHIPQGGSMKDCPPELRNNSDLKRAMRRLHLNQVSPTIVHNNNDHYYHPLENRRITIREMARIQGYPDTFIFCGPKTEQSRQVGNSVPVPFAYHIGLSVLEFLDGN